MKCLLMTQMIRTGAILPQSQVSKHTEYVQEPSMQPPLFRQSTASLSSDEKQLLPEKYALPSPQRSSKMVNASILLNRSKKGPHYCQRNT